MTKGVSELCQPGTATCCSRTAPKMPNNGSNTAALREGGVPVLGRHQAGCPRQDGSRERGLPGPGRRTAVMPWF
jgi:hypothetical protein